jgi:hypothetical protein
MVKPNDDISDYNYMIDSKHGNWIRYEDYIKGKESMTPDAVLGEGWRDASKELPDNNKAFECNNEGWLWVKIEGGDIQLSCYDEDDGFDYNDVTHFMYLQKPGQPDTKI